MIELTSKQESHILLTRHDSKNAWLQSSLLDMGHSVSELQLLTMKPVKSAQARFTSLSENHTYTDIIFVSPASVEFSAHFLKPDDLKGVNFFAVGRGTADSFSNSSGSGSNITYPEVAAGAEALLALPEMESLIDRRFLIVTGVDGKSLLADELILGSAKVDILECYQREKTHALQKKLQRIINNDVTHVFLHSKHAAEYFLEGWKNINQEEKAMPKLILGASSIKDIFSESKYFEEFIVADSPVNKDMLLAFQNIT